MTDTDLTQSTELASWDDLLKRVAKAEAPGVVKVALPAKFSDKQLDAVKSLTKVFGSVVPTEPRQLSKTEIDALLAERQVVDIVARLTSQRKDDIALSVKHHHDAVVVEQDPDAERTKDGHFAVSGRYGGEDNAEQVFSVEVRKGSVKVDLDRLASDADDDGVGDLTHEDYLALTRPVRVIDPDRAATLLRKRPELLGVLERYVTQGAPSVSTYVRKR